MRVTTFHLIALDFSASSEPPSSGILSGFDMVSCSTGDRGTHFCFAAERWFARKDSFAGDKARSRKLENRDAAQPALGADP